MPEEKRTKRRVVHRQLATISRPQRVDALYEVIDISVGGLRIRTNGDSFGVNDEVRISMELTGAEIEIDARVAHVTGDEAGLEFSNLTGRNSDRVLAVVLADSWRKRLGEPEPDADR